MKKFRFGMLITFSLLVVITFVFSVAMADEDFLVYLPMVTGVRDSQPTQTPTATSMPTATSTPTATPTQEPSGVVILDNDTSYVDSLGLLNVVAEVQNNTANTVNLDSISVKFYDAGNNLLETEIGIVVLDNLPANEKTCFDVELIEPSGWSYYEIESPSYLSIGDFPFPNLTILNDTFSYNSTFDFWEIEGQVRNDHGSTVDDVVLVGTLYNAAGDVIGCDSELFDVFSLDPGETDNFDISFVGRDYADYDSHRVQADGDTLP